jgi:hypothetical protein
MDTGAEETEDFHACTVCWMEYDAQQHLPKVLNCFHTICLRCAQVKPIADMVFFSIDYWLKHLTYSSHFSQYAPIRQ